MRQIAFFPVAFVLLALCGCGYHTLGAATHLPPDMRTLSVPVFATRTRLRVTPREGGDADALLHGTILKEYAAPLTYNAATQESSSFLITIVVSVTLTGRDGKVLYENKNYVYRQQYQSTTDLPTFLVENPAGLERLSREFARALVADVLEGF